MAGKADDGAIYIGVRPDFGGFDTELRKQARESGLKFGKDLADSTDDSFAPELKRKVGQAIDKATDKPAEIKAELDDRALQSKVKALRAQKIEIQAKLDADTKAAQAKVDQFARQQATLQAKVDLNDADAKAKVDALEARKIQIEAKVEADTAAAKAKLDSIDRDIHVNLHVDSRGVDQAEFSVRKLGSAAESAFSSSGNLGLALASLGPAALPSLAAATAGVVALGAAVGGASVAALGTGLLAFHGLGDAVKALNDQENRAAQAAAKASNAATQMAQQHLAAAGATDQLKSAQAGLANTVANAAEATRQAAERVTSAEEDLRTAQQRSRDAQLDLTEARKDAARQLEDLNDRLKDSSLSEEEAALRVEEAQDRLNKTREKGSKASELDKREAELALKRAQLNAEQQTKDTARLRQDKAAADKAGVEGSKQVQAAQKTIAAANKGVADAEKKISDARLDQVQVERRNATQIAQAKQSIVAANRAIQASALSMQKVAVPAVDKVADAFRGKSKAFKDFATFIHGLGPGIDQLAAAGQKELFPKLETAIRGLSPLMPILKKGIGDVASAMGDAAIEFSKALVSPEGQAFLKQILKDAPDTIRQLGTFAAVAAKSLASIFTAAGPAGKELLTSVITNLNDFFKRISTPEGKKSLETFFRRGVDMVKALGTLIGSIMGVFGALIGAGDEKDNSSVAGTIRSIAGVLDKLSAAIRNNSHSIDWIKGIALAFAGFLVLGRIVGFLSSVVTFFGESGLGGILIRFAIAPALEAIGAALAALGAPVLIVIGVIALLAAGFYLAYTRSETFRRIVNKSVDAVGRFFKSVWEDVLKPTFKYLGDAFVFLYKNIVEPYMTAMGVAIDIAWKAIQITFGLWQIGMTLLGEAVKYLYDHYVAPIFDYIGQKISDVWTGVIQPVFVAFGDFLKIHVIPKLQDAAAIIGGIFSGVKAAWEAALSGVVGLVNKIIDVYNGVADKFPGVIHVEHVSNPFASTPSKLPATSNPTGSRGAIPLARGGQVRGPGTGTSDDIPVFLSNGEFVLRAAAVQSLGLPFLDLLNKADQLDQRGGDPSRTVLGVPRYADGGLIGATQQFIRAQDPKPYIWGAVGPSAYDCSGLVGAVMALLTGRNPYHRYMTTSSSMQALGFQRGHGAFTIGLDPGVHVVGNLAGLPFEAANPRAGIKVGGGAQSVDRLPQQWFLPQIGNQFVAAGGGSGSSGGGFDISALARAAFSKVIGSVGDLVGDFVPGGSFRNLGLGVANKLIDDVLPFDQGGWLPPGNTLVRNNTGKPEAILNPSQWASVERSVSRPEINILYPPHVPPEQALVDAQARYDLISTF